MTSPASPARPLTSLVYTQTKLPDWDWTDYSHVPPLVIKPHRGRLPSIRTRCSPEIDRQTENFRHGSWALGRRAVANALRVGVFSRRRRERFLSCGCRGRVEFNAATQRFRVRAWFCGDRFCRPCSRSRAAKIQKKVAAMFTGKSARFVTLTLRASQDGCRKILTRLLKAFAKLRRVECWREAVSGGVRFVEVTRGKLGTHWHVHLHILVTGWYLDWKQLKRAWHEITGDSHRVDVRDVPNLEKGVWYVAKYSAKGCADSLWNSPRHLLEWMQATSGRRLVGSFGVCRCGRMECSNPQGSEYTDVGSLRSVMAAAERGETYAVAIISNLKPKPGQSNDAHRAISKAFKRSE